MAMFIVLSMACNRELTLININGTTRLISTILDPGMCSYFQAVAELENAGHEPCTWENRTIKHEKNHATPIVRFAFKFFKYFNRLNSSNKGRII